MSNTETRPTLGQPDTRYEYDEDGNAYDPSVGWGLSWGCAVTFSFEGDELHVTVSTSDEDKRRGVTHRAVTREQVVTYARQLLFLVGEATAHTDTAQETLRKMSGRDTDNPGLHRLVRETLEAAHKRGDGIDGQTDAVMAVIRVTIAH
jgi:hypothetical protein